MAGYEEQFLAHGVHMIFDGERGLPWTSVEASKRTSKLVLIGKKLDEAKLKSEFLACISKKS